MNSYWNHTGKYQHMIAELIALVPMTGVVEHPRTANKALEQFRQASNAYYDLFNNGGGNRDQAIRKFFTSSALFWIKSQYQDSIAHVYEYTEPAMDEIVLAAWTEQLGNKKITIQLI